MSLSDEQVQAEMHKMVSFIKQEAFEKAKEIHTLSEEEFQVEKAKIVREQCDAIDQTYDMKLKRASMAQKIAKSNVLNKSRLEILNSKQKVIDDIFSRVEKKLDGIEQKKDAYTKFMADLIVQAMELLGEPVGIVYSRQRDAEIVKAAIPKATEVLKSKNGSIDYELDAETDDFLNDSVLGGVVLVGLGGKIRVDNTLRARLEIVKEEALPEIRRLLFGENPNRKFDN